MKFIRTILLTTLTLLTLTISAQITADSLVKDGSALMKEKKYLDAIEKFSQAISMDSTHTAAYFSRFFASFKEESATKYVFPDAVKVLTLEPDGKKASNVKRFINEWAMSPIRRDRFVQLCKDNPEEMIKNCSQLIDVAPELNKRSLHFRSLAYLYSGDNANACADGNMLYDLCIKDKDRSCLLPLIFSEFQNNRQDCLSSNK